MPVSSARLNTVRGVLVVLTIWWLFFGIAGIFSPGQLAESMFKESLTPGLQTIAAELGAMTLAWAVAFAIALRDPLRHRGLMQAIITSLVIFFIAEVYVTIAFGSNWPAWVWVSNALLIILAGVIWVAYPWGQETT